MDFVVDTTRLPVGTIFFGYCTGKGQLGITEGPYEDSSQSNPDFAPSSPCPVGFKALMS